MPYDHNFLIKVVSEGAQIATAYNPLYHVGSWYLYGGHVYAVYDGQSPMYLGTAWTMLKRLNAGDKETWFLDLTDDAIKLLEDAAARKSPEVDKEESKDKTTQKPKEPKWSGGYTKRRSPTQEVANWEKSVGDLGDERELRIPVQKAWLQSRVRLGINYSF